MADICTDKYNNYPGRFRCRGSDYAVEKMIGMMAVAAVPWCYKTTDKGYVGASSSW